MDMLSIFLMLKHNVLMVMIIAIAFAIVATISMFCICKMFFRNRVCDVSDNNESFVARLGMSQGLIGFSLQELKNATNNFGESNLIGSGRFGPVYKGLIGNTLVAIKRLSGPPHPRFLNEVTSMSNIRHRNVITVLGYCCENGHQMIVYEYLINHQVLHVVDLELEKRVSIALGAAKGLHHLHNLTPPLTHNRFKAEKVLLDIDMNAKITNAGLLATREEEAAAGHDLESGLVEQEHFDEANDVYGFGIFLVELIMGKEPVGLDSISSNEELISWMAPQIRANTFVDQRMNGTYNIEDLKNVMFVMLLCMQFPATRRPKMREVVTKLEKIYPTEEQAPTQITLGSEIFNI